MCFEESQVVAEGFDASEVVGIRDNDGLGCDELVAGVRQSQSKCGLRIAFRGF